MAVWQGCICWLDKEYELDPEWEHLTGRWRWPGEIEWHPYKEEAA